jgi:hypothetical protein
VELAQIQLAVEQKFERFDVPFGLGHVAAPGVMPWLSIR